MYTVVTEPVKDIKEFRKIRELLERDGIQTIIVYGQSGKKKGWMLIREIDVETFRKEFKIPKKKGLIQAYIRESRKIKEYIEEMQQSRSR